MSDLIPVRHRHGQHDWHDHTREDYDQHQQPIDDEYRMIRTPSDDGYQLVAIQGRPKRLSDGHHTMEDLYDHRRALTAALLAERADISWKSKEHHPDDGPMFEGGYFVVGMDTPAGTISYHYKLTHWDDFAEVPELPHAPKWDGATPADTVARLLGWARDELVP